MRNWNEVSPYSDASHRGSEKGMVSSRKWIVIVAVNTIVAVLLLAVALASCASGPQPKQARLGQEFQLAVGQTAQLAGEDLEIHFERVTGDSRCARGNVCVWAGEVACLLQITDRGVTDPLLLVQPGGSENATTTYKNYSARFLVMPYPEAGIPIKTEEYRLAMTFTK